VPGVVARRDFPNEAGQPLPWSLIIVDPAKAGLTKDEIVDRLWTGDPAIAVASTGLNSFHLNPMTLEPGEEQIVLKRLLEILGR
jgi:L-seryl-tRNA(Ser) seleniumtransferase